MISLLEPADISSNVGGTNTLLLLLFGFSATVNTYLNGLSGIEIGNNTNVDIILEKGVSLTACNNGGNTVETLPRADILNNGNGDIIGLGVGRYTCDSTGGSGELPRCKPCPACYVSLKHRPFSYGSKHEEIGME